MRFLELSSRRIAWRTGCPPDGGTDERFRFPQIAPTDVETVLLSHCAVFDAGVTSRDGPHGDLLVGVVKVKPGGGDVEADQLVSYVKSMSKVVRSYTMGDRKRIFSKEFRNSECCARSERLLLYHVTGCFERVLRAQKSDDRFLSEFNVKSTPAARFSYVIACIY